MKNPNIDFLAWCSQVLELYLFQLLCYWNKLDPREGRAGGVLCNVLFGKAPPEVKPHILVPLCVPFWQNRYRPLWCTFMGKGTKLPFHLPNLVKLIPFDTPEARKRSPSQAEHPSVDHYNYSENPEMIPTPKWPPTLKWSPNRSRNDPNPEMIPTFLLDNPEIIPKELGNGN